MTEVVPVTDAVMDCQASRRALYRRLDGGEEADDRRLCEHVAGCAPCARAERAAAALRTHAAGRAVARAAPDFTDRVIARIAGRKARIRSVVPLLRAAAAAATLLFVVTGALLLADRPAAAPRPETTVTADGAIDLILRQVAGDHARLPEKETGR